MYCVQLYLFVVCGLSSQIFNDILGLISTMRRVFNLIYLIFLLVLVIFFSVDGRATSLKDTRTDELTNATIGKKNWWDFKKAKQDSFLNPVLQNYSSLFEFLNVAQTKREKRNARHSRQNRQRGRDCTGQCENSLCPWREVWDEERTRIPQFIKYAMCDSPTCNFSHFGIDFGSSFTLQIRTHCDLVKIDILVTENGEEKWLTGWPIACVCAQRVVDIDSSIGHPGRSSDQVDVDITRHEPLEPVLQQRVVLQGTRPRSLSRAQRRRLRNQHRNMQNIESWEQIMERKYNNT